MTELSLEGLERLEALAKAATQGEWRNGLDDREAVWSAGSVALLGDGNVVCCPPEFGMKASQVRWPDNAAHIAAFDPPTVLALIALARLQLSLPTGGGEAGAQNESRAAALVIEAAAVCSAHKMENLAAELLGAVNKSGLVVLPDATSPQAGGAPNLTAQRDAETEILQDYRWGHLTRLGVAAKLQRAGFNQRTAVEKANALYQDHERADRCPPPKDTCARCGSGVGELCRLLPPQAGGGLREALEDLHEKIEIALSCQEQDVKVNGARHPGLLEPMRDILRLLQKRSAACLALSQADASQGGS